MQDGRDNTLRLDWLPPPGFVLCSVPSVKSGEALVVEFRQDWRRYEIFVLRYRCGFVAYHNECPHSAKPLDWMGRFLTRDKEFIRCAGHGAKFRIDDGYCIKGPCIGARLTPCLLYTSDAADE